MFVGFHHLDDSDASAPLEAATFLDISGAGAGMRSPERMARVYFKGRPQPAEVAQKARAWHQGGCRVVLGNEPNLPSEQFGGGPQDYAEWFRSVRAKLPAGRVYWAGMSPGVPGWEDWYAGAGVADGIAAHAYGDLSQMKATVEQLIPLGKPLWIAECNFGAGQVVDRDLWAVDHLRPFLDWCATVPLVEAVTYFAYRWPTPDTPLPTPVDAAGTQIEAVLREWQAPIPPEEPTVIKGIDISNNNGAVDLAQVKGAGYEFVICKAAEDPAFVDQFLPQFWQAALQQELVRGAYCFARPSESSPAESVALFQRAVARAGGFRAGDVYALDIEDERYAGSLHQWVAEWLDLAERVFGFPGFKYSGRWYTETRDLEHPDLERWPTWWASYQSTQPAPTTGWSPITIWQNSASGTVLGVQGNCDTNVFLGTADKLRALGKPGAVEPVPGPLPDPWRRVDDDLARLTASIQALKEAVR